MATSEKDVSDKISPNFLEELLEVYKKEGLSAMKSKVQDNLKEWQRIPIHIGITGDSGSGKSSFINAIRELTADDEGAAAVDVTETTKEPTVYTHPDNESFKLWDLPGVGTPNFPQRTYLQQVDFERYDFFLIFSSSRFTENDLWLSKKVEEQGKKNYFIRTKIDVDIQSDRLSHPRTNSRRNVLEKIRHETKEKLNDVGFRDPKIFLIDNYNRSNFDFGILTTTLMQEAPEIKKEAFALSLAAVSEEIIQEKRKYLKKRIFVVSIASAVSAAVPIPGVGMLVDATILLEEVLFYRKQLRLDDKSVQEAACALRLTADELKNKLQLTIRLISFTVRGIVSFCTSLGISEATETIVSITIPIIGSIIGAGISYGVQVYCLRGMLNKMVDDALKIHQYTAMMTKI